MKSEIIAVGTELLLGQVVNTNATFLSEELATLGLDVYYHSVVGDNPERLHSLLELAEKRSELIILCGGLGPTTDDLTKQVTAAHVNQELVQDPDGYQNLMAFFEQRNRPMTENNLLQTLVFKDGIPLKNSTGLALGIFYSTPGGTHYLLLPGPPSELKPMFLNEARPVLLDHFFNEEQLISRVLRFYGIGESRLVTDLADIIETQSNPTIAPYAKVNEVTLRLTVKTVHPEEGRVQLDKLEQQVLERVGDYFYGYGEDNSLAKVVIDTLKKQGKTVTAAESLTAGAFQAEIGSVAGVSEVFPGGFVTYSPETKIDFLQINPTLIEKKGMVSSECVEAMALHAKQLAKTDVAIAFSGVAGPQELEGKSVGTVWIAIATDEKVTSSEFHFARDRNAIRQSAVMAGLDLLRKELLQ